MNLTPDQQQRKNLAVSTAKKYQALLKEGYIMMHRTFSHLDVVTQIDIDEEEKIIHIGQTIEFDWNTDTRAVWDTAILDGTEEEILDRFKGYDLYKRVTLEDL